MEEDINDAMHFSGQKLTRYSVTKYTDSIKYIWYNCMSWPKTNELLSAPASQAYGPTFTLRLPDHM